MTDIIHQAKWYIAELVIECRIENDLRNVVHVNIVLVRASSSEDAFEKAEQLGHEGADTYLNPDGRVVTFTYRGLRDLYLVYEDELEHGTELVFEEEIDVSEEDLQEMITPKSELALFRPNQPQDLDKPNYACKGIMDEVERMINPGDTASDWEQN